MARRVGAAFAVFVVRFAEVAVRALARTLSAPRLGAVFLTAALDALCARALPAGERLVAGFKRADFGLTVRLRMLDAPREVTRFVALLTALLIDDAHHSYTKMSHEPWRSLTQLHL